jgi:hypothetical protein
MISVPKTALPPTLYKYYPPERVDIIENLQIRFSAPSEFNDTFDTQHQLSPPLEAQSSPAQAMIAKAKSRLAQARFRNELGVFCLTAHAGNHLMWVNYAEVTPGLSSDFERICRSSRSMAGLCVKWFIKAARLSLTPPTKRARAFTNRETGNTSKSGGACAASAMKKGGS